MSEQQQGAGVTQMVGNWWRQPFNASGSALQWVLFVGLLIIAAFLWQITLLKITQEI
jgi:hypothetical protein